jgi:serine phosphatase RsbU (regulator of sigma subunit)
MYKKLFFLVLITFLVVKVNAQNNYIDSILSVGLSKKTDSLKFDYLYTNNVTSLFGKGRYDEIKYLLKKIKDKKFITSNPSNNLSVIAALGTLNYVSANSNLAIEYYAYAIDLCDSFPKIADRKPDIISKLAVVFSDLGQSEKAKSLYREAITTLLLTNDSLEIEYSHYFNLGAEYLNQDSVKQSIPFFKKAGEISELKQDTLAIINCATALASILVKEESYREAQKYTDKAISLSLQIEDTSGYANGLLALSDILEAQNQIKKAIVINEKAREILFNYGKISRYLEITKTSANLYNKEGFYEKSSTLFKEYIDLSDSLNTSKTGEQLASFEAKYENTKKENEIKLLKKQEEVRSSQEDKKNILIIASGVGLLLLTAFVIFIYKKLLLTKRQNNLIRTQKRLVDDQRETLIKKNDQILDSINYAKKIQKAVIPTEELIKSSFSDAFVFFKPKDIVSGDFYWQQKVGDLIFIAVVDCTGHGVPGAFMSMIGNSLLDKCVIQLGIKSPEKILNKLNIELYKKLSVNEDSKVKDGMDLFVCCIDLTKMKLYASGAYNPMYIVREKELTEFKGDKLHLGNLEHTQDKSYTLHDFDLQKEDCIYLFTDGFPDQKGGEKSKKFYYPPFRKLLTEISTQKMEGQKELLSETFNNWKGDLNQIDDVCILGLRI